jgi:hypothetical protein
VPFVSPDAALAFFVLGVALPLGVQNPPCEIETANQTTAVLAPAPGRVVNITTTSQSDRTIFILPSDNSVFDLVRSSGDRDTPAGALPGG